jgi:hypothetical protein
MDEKVSVSPKELVVIAVIFISMIGSLVYGFLLLKENQNKKNCWEQYVTEQEAILNCEGKE